MDNENVIVTCEMINKLGSVFEYYNIYENFGLTFEEYFKKWLNGIDVTKYHGKTFLKTIR